ncbi:hypothetical protein SNE40_010435 [Patella caerulea]|uniref:Uncharacterized protein n=1 Tax=Patella caerulea TaxID=87958 RepID=A0AAN8JUG2_PATCE
MEDLTTLNADLLYKTSNAHSVISACHMDLNDLTGNTLVPDLFAVRSKSSNQVEAVNGDSQAQLSTGPIIEKSYNKEDEPDQDISITEDSIYDSQPVDVRHKMDVIT